MLGKTFMKVKGGERNAGHCRLYKQIEAKKASTTRGQRWRHCSYKIRKTEKHIPSTRAKRNLRRSDAEKYEGGGGGIAGSISFNSHCRRTYEHRSNARDMCFVCFAMWYLYDHL